MRPQAKISTYRTLRHAAIQRRVHIIVLDHFGDVITAAVPLRVRRVDSTGARVAVMWDNRRWSSRDPGVAIFINDVITHGLILTSNRQQPMKSREGIPETAALYHITIGASAKFP